MNEKPKADIIDVIRKILSKTEANGCTPAEAEFAFAMAARKLAEHNLTMEDVATPEGGEESWIEEELIETGRWSLEDNLCYGILKKFYFCEGFFNRRNGKKVFLLFGKPENVAIGRHVWGALHASFDRCWTMYRYLNKRPASEKRLFVSGMAKGFSQKLRGEREVQVIERDLMSDKGTGTALALVNINDKILAAYKASHPEHKASKGRMAQVVGDRSTLAAGYGAWRSLNLNRALSANGRKGIGGR